MSLIKKNFIYICDDTCLLCRRGLKKIGVLGLPSDFGKNISIIKNNLKKNKRLSPFVVSARKKMHFPKFIIFPKIIRAKNSRLAPISKNNALIKLVSLSQLIRHEDNKMISKHTQILKNLSKQCGCFELSMGENREEPAEIISTLLNS